MARSFRSSLKRSAAAGAAFVMLSGAVLTPSAASAQAQANSPLAPPPGAGPASVADLAEGLLDAVVNISTSQSVKDEGEGPQKPAGPEGSPFQDLFNDFFDGDGKEQGNRKVNSLGSGFVIDPAGFVVTNNHVIEGADDIEVVFPNGDKLKAKLIGTDTKTDLSVLKVEPKTPLKAVRFGDSRKMRIGDWVMAIGNPFGLGGSVTLGIISARGRNINAGPYDNFIQTDASINKGNSGGPLFNTKGEVIGINTAIISPSGGSIGIGFAVPTELAENVVKQLIEFGETRRGWLGVRIQPVTDDVSSSLGLKSAQGALVSGVIKGGPVDNGSIKAGDVILSFDGKPVKEMRDLPLAVAESPVGKEVDVVVMRDGKEQTVKVTLGQLEDSAEPEENAGQPVLPEGEGEDMEPDNDTAENQGPDVKPPADTDAVAPSSLGLALSTLGEDQRKSFGIGAAVNGVVITAVEPNTAAAEKGLKAGEVIVEVGQDQVKSPEDVTKRVQTLKNEGRRFAHMMVSGANGELRIVAVPLE
ncbi:Do family serine endopeptidase [Rhizobiales bacterium RZME27]|uniref:Probable periplasmic serine endoprotease DegP-like n=1 Tax=Endobacterium cereale TaxID=2663029 RepID=A0A6A8AEQ8_9HYPH|nr:DegQ family serine endoprotease [Endobacterium cereale]MEB2843283.1 DegQ family serine endoprotease [Endobacterium cereale]MQY47241.1 Do family serine endopeptidase [Endobacterium cereale]